MFVADLTKPPSDIFMYTLHPARLEMMTGGASAAEKALVTQHWMHSIELLKKGVILYAGRTMDVTPDSHATVVLRARTKEEAQSIMESDPAVKGGLFRAKLFQYQPMLSE